MAIIPCRECAHQVSDQAASCPGCGAPISSTVKTKRRKRHVVSRILITLMTLWTVGTLLWLIVPSGVPDRLVLSAKSSLQRLTQGQHPNAATDQLARPAPVIPAPSQLVPVLRPVYRTTAEQLYQAYETNVVAIQTKIGASRVRLSGTVAEIDQDATGRPVVKLWTGKDTTAAMTLAEAQRTAAAQLVKGESVEIECDRIGHSEAALQGSGCTLAFVDVRTHEVNLALFLANEKGTARVYVVGPMSEASCRAHSDDISSLLQKTSLH